MNYTKSKVLFSGVVVALLLSMVMIPFQALPVKAADDLHLTPWVKSPETDVLTKGDQGAFDETGVGAACIIKDGSTYKMWYSGYGENETLQIGYAYSDNGTTWTRGNGGLPVLPPGDPGAWDEKGVGSPCVIKVYTNDYRMWYTGYKEVNDELIPQIGYATSSNGINWDKHGGDGGPVLTRGGPEKWDKKGVHSPWVIKENGTYSMWYTGRGGAPILGNSAIGYATWDGLADNFSKYKEGAAPVLEPTGGTWDQRGAATACVIKDSGSYYMWYSGYSGFDTGNIAVKIGSAQSDNATAWSKNANAVLTYDETGWNTRGVGAPCVIKETEPNRLIMWYSGLDADLNSRLDHASNIVQLSGNVTLEGGKRPYPNGFDVPLTLKLYDSTASLSYLNIMKQPGQGGYVAPLFTFIKASVNATAGDNLTITGSDNTTKIINFSANVSTGTYDITLYTPHGLISLKEDKTITATESSVNMGTLKEGNVNNDVQIQSLDFSALITDYLAVPGDPNWNDGRSDFDRNGQVTSIDFSLLADNYLLTSPQTAP